ncbi:MAG: ATP-binding cassette domain-containing protein [Deltaproteobacteria bacterium]|nr:ATP-binding cassette domain-containing protein [Deltaproteobacteria bacterium]
MLWLEGIGCRRHGVTVLDGVTLGVGSGEIVVIEGSPASGKSTLLEVAATARVPERGAVWFAGRNTASLQRASLPFVRRNIGYYTAEALLIDDDSALANVMAALAVRGESLQAAESGALDALALVRAQELASRQVASLSSGQKRLVALARALAGPPPLVVADEPAAFVDDEARAVVVSALARVRDLGAAVLAATADTALADVLVAAGGRRIHLEQGRVAGAPAVELVPALHPPQDERETGPSRLLAGERDDGDRSVPAPAAKGPR